MNGLGRITFTKKHSKIVIMSSNSNGILPRKNIDKQAWLKNFANKLGQYASKYNITTAEVNDIIAADKAYSYYLNYKIQYGEFHRKLHAYLNEIAIGINAQGSASVAPSPPVLGTAPVGVAPGVFIRARSLSKRIKSHLAYTVADGLDLGIEKPTSKAVKPNLSTIKPTIVLRLMEGGQPEVVWKKNDMDALEIWVDRGNGFEFCDIDTKPNYIDKHALPQNAELWKYKVIYRIDDKIVGSWSDIVSITVVKQLL